MEKGLLIAFEGVDASGLTTHSKLLVETLSSLGLKSIYTKEPTRGPIGTVIREFLRDKRGLEPSLAELLALLFAADRHWHLRYDPTLPGGGILGAISSGFIVVSDRYKYSSIAYQGLHAGFEWVWEINSRARDADIIVFLDVDCKAIEERLSSRRDREVYENIDTLREIKTMFRKIFYKLKKSKIIIIKINYNESRMPSKKLFREKIFPPLSAAIKDLGITLGGNPHEAPIY